MSSEIFDAIAVAAGARAIEAVDKRYEITQRMSLSSRHEPQPVVVLDKESGKDYDESIVSVHKTMSRFPERETAYDDAAKVLNNLKAKAVLTAAETSLRERGMMRDGIGYDDFDECLEWRAQTYESSGRFSFHVVIIRLPKETS
jgi:hypothetical protein